jgi:hypothetical protein
MNDRQLDRVLNAWLDEGPSVAGPVVVDGAMARISTVRQVRTAGWRSPDIRVAIPARWRPALAVVVTTIILAGMAYAIIIVGGDARPDPIPEPTASASAPSADDATATGAAAVHVTGATDVTDEWYFTPGDPSGEPGLSMFRFFDRGVADEPVCNEDKCGPDRAYLSIYLVPAEVSPGTRVTGPRLMIAIGFPGQTRIGGAAGDPSFSGSFISRAGECEVTITTATASEVAGSFECLDVPSRVNRDRIDASGTFSFDPTR